MNTSQMLIAFLAFGASASSIVAWRFAASKLWRDEPWFLYPPQCWWCFSNHCRSFPPCSVCLASDHVKAKVMSLRSLSF